MTPVDIGLLGIAVLLVLLALRMPIALSLAIVSFAGMYLIRGEVPAMWLLKNVPREFITHWTLSAVPMFLLMGALAANLGMTSALFQVARTWLGWLPGGLAIATNFAGAGFAAASGSSLATTATMGRIAVPEMLRLGYQPALATATAAAVGTLGAVIPPSIIMVIYAVFAEESVGKMLIAGILPGLLTAAAYGGMIYIRCLRNPSLAPNRDDQVRTRDERRRDLLAVWPMPVLILGIIGGIYSGIVTATEAGALGAALAIIIGGAQRKLSVKVLVDSAREAALATGMIFFVAIGAALFTYFLAMSRLPGFLTASILTWTDSPMAVVLICAVIYLVLGCFLDSLGVLLLTLPVMLPVFHALGIDGIWIGVILIKLLEIGLLTPPVGLNVYIMKGVLEQPISLGTIFSGLKWFLLAEAVVMTLLIAFPEIILVLPGLM